MSMSPSRLLQRLQDLRVWQQSQEDLLLLNKQKKSGSDSNVNNQNETARASDYNTIEGLSAFDSTFDEECGGDVPRTDSKDCWESKPISPAKPFEQLLAEKLAEDVNQAEGDGRAGGPRPRQPFLRKGSGLQRFRMKPGDQAKIPPHPRRSKSKPRPPGPRKKLEKSLEKPLENPEVVKTFKKTEVAGILLTPLKVPNLSIKPKAVWCPVVQQQPAETNVTVEVTPALTAGPSEQTLYEKQLEKELMIFEALERRADNSSFCSTNSSVVQLLSQISNNQMNNSNNQNNSSTPGKKNFVLVEKTAPLTRVEEELEKHVRWDEETSPPSPVAGQPRALLREENIAQLLLQLQKIADFNTKSKATVAGCVEVVAAQRQQQQQQLLSTPFSEESEDTSSSSVTTEHSLSDSISSTDLDTTLKEKSKQDAAVGTSDVPLHGDRCCQSAFHEKQKFPQQQDDKQQIKSLSCDFCQNQLDRKLQEYTEKIDGLSREKSSLANLRRDLQQKAQSLEENFEKRLREVEEERKLFLYELESDRKKLAKEKALVQSYIKDTQNKKDRDEVKTLKQEVADLRETLKLKETKNGQTQARLRNQVKQLEKENARLKDDIERLQKDNAKLTAAQKLQQQQRHINKSADSKILQEINKNITKMAKEAAATMNITRDREPSREQIMHNGAQISPISSRRRKSSENNNNNNSSKSRTLSEDQKESLVEQDEEDRDEDRTNEQRRRGRTTTTDAYRKSDGLDDSLLLLDTTNFRNPSYGATAGIQKQYESVFLRRNLTLNDSKNKERTERLLDDGSKEIKYSNGNTKTVSADGNFAVMRYYNGDIKETLLTDGIVKYFYKDKNIWQTSYPDGTELIEFPEGPKERRFQDGKCEVTFPDGMFQTVFPDGNQEVVYPDGSRLQIKTDGEKILHLPNGQREIQTKEHKRREYPDGTVKILYPDGSQETRYSNGRVRMKDPQGHLIMDTHQPQT